MKNILSSIFLIITCFSFSQEKNNEFEKSIKTLYNKAISVAFKDQDSGYFYLQKSIALSKQKKHWQYAMDAYFESYNIAFHYNNLHKKKIILKSIDSLYNKQEHYFNKLDNTLKYKNHINYYYGFYFFRLNNYDTSKKYFQNIIDDTENQDSETLKKNKTFLSVAYSYIAKMNADEGKLSESSSLYQKNIRLLKKIDSTNKSSIFYNYNLLAEVLKKEKKHTASNAYFLKSLAYHISKNSPNSIMSSSFNIAKNYIELSKIDSAKYYLNIAKKHLNKNHLYNTTYHELNSQIYSQENNYSKAILELNKALYFYKNYATTAKNKNQNLGLAYTNIGELQQKFNKPNLALNNFNTAIQFFKNDSIKSSINNIHLLKTLKLKANTLNNIGDFKKTIVTVDYASSILDELKPSFKNNNDKLFLIENAFPLFEYGINAAYQLNIKSKKNNYIEKAFLYTEKSKSVLLLEALLNSKATEYANIPIKILEEEEILKNEITSLEKKINSNKNETLEDELFNLKIKHRKFVEKLETDYKNYYNLKYNFQAITLNETKKMLNNNEQLISYFFGENALYTISVSRNNNQLIKTSLNSNIKSDIELTYRMLSNPKSNLNQLKNRLKTLHKNTIAPISLMHKNLIIIPDGLLNYIPFATLIDNNSKYLIENHTVSYINSATLLKQLQSKQINNHNLLAFAPSFSNNNSLLPLPNNKKEADNCLNYFKGSALKNENATLTKFNTESPKYSILHLATHAVFNDYNPEYSFLAFSENPGKENLLYTKDLYNLKLNADLVTLSACESGIGELKRGEGLMSLARGFYFSGAKSIASTLWKINDASATNLMDNFYLNLSKGSTKNSALQKAQVNFINNNRDNALNHPYYWAGFIISGNIVALNTTNYWLWIGIATALALLLLLYLKRKN